jgi:hypothetical protein
VSLVAEAKQRLTIQDIGAQLFPGWKPGKSCRCPWREDRNPSFSVSPDGRLFNDFASGEGGDVVKFLALARGVSESEAAKEFITLAGVRGGEGATPLAPAPARPVEPEKERAKPDLPDLDEGSPEEHRALANLRGLNVEAIRLAVARGLLRFCESREGRAWVITDADRWAAQARRIDGERWQRLTGGPKAWTLAGSRASWPIGWRDAVERDRIALCEGGPDALACLHHALASGVEKEIGVVAMIGAACRIPPECLASFAGKRVRVFVHADVAGLKAAQKWAAQLIEAGASVDGFAFDGLLKSDGGAVKDLNDLALIGADSWEENRALIEAVTLF